MSDIANNGMVERSTSIREIRVQSPVATVVKTGSDSSNQNARQQVRESRVLGDDHYKRMTSVTVCVAC